MEKALCTVILIILTLLGGSCAKRLEGTIASNEECPSESTTNSNVHIEDIEFFVETPYEARRTITDGDSLLMLRIENLSGKYYFIENVTLEMKENDEWRDIKYRYFPIEKLPILSNSCNNLSLYEPLVAGDYRLRMLMNTYETSNILLVNEFTVIKNKDADANWELSRLEVSPYGDANQSPDVQMAFANPILNKRNINPRLIITANRLYHYSEAYTIEVLLDGNWYTVPIFQGMFHNILLNVGQDAPTDIYSHQCNPNPLHDYGVLPMGQYRLIKEFKQLDLFETADNYSYLDSEFAIAEFTVAETLDWQTFYSWQYSVESSTDCMVETFSQECQ